jgi:membrane protease YdiL (CAAX protease family)
MLPHAATVTGLILALAGLPVVALAAGQFEAKAPFLAHVLALLAIAGLTAAIVAVVLFWERQPLASIGLMQPTLMSVAIGVAIAAAFIAVIGPLVMRVPGWLGLPGFEASIAQAARLPVWYLVLTIVIVATAEEILYRGYAIERLTAMTGSLWLACFVSVTMFGLAHVPMWGWGPALTTYISGAILAAVYVWLRDLTPLIVAHVLVDMVGLMGPRLTASAP